MTCLTLPDVVAPRGEARSDTAIVFDLACHLGLGMHFWTGTLVCLPRPAPSLRRVTRGATRAPGRGTGAAPHALPQFAEQQDGIPKGFATPTRKIELYSETLLEHGYPPLPEYEEPLIGPHSRLDLAEHYPLILTSAKHTLFCESQHRALPSLRRRALDPQVKLHPAAAARGIGAGDWVRIETPEGSVSGTGATQRHAGSARRLRSARLVAGLPRDRRARLRSLECEWRDLNLIIGNAAIDPISGSVPHCAYLCQIRRADCGPPRQWLRG